MRTFFSYREQDSDVVHRVKRFLLSSEPEIVTLLGRAFVRRGIQLAHG